MLPKEDNAGYQLCHPSTSKLPDLSSVHEAGPVAGLKHARLMPSRPSAPRSSSMLGLRNAYVMDTVLAIGLGLTLRQIVGTVLRYDLKVGASLVGLWEGLVLDHFLNKIPPSSPESFDPYIGYGIRLFIDFLFTWSIWRMGIVILWTGLGVVLSRITPVVWSSTGLRELYKDVRRDWILLGLPTLSSVSKIPTASRVQFVDRSSRTASSDSSDPTSPAVTPRPLKSRPLPGSFPGDLTTETDATSLSGTSDFARHLPALPSSNASESDTSTIRNNRLLEDPRDRQLSFQSGDSTSDNGDTDRGDHTPTANPPDLPSDEELYVQETHTNQMIPDSQTPKVPLSPHFVDHLFSPVRSDFPTPDAPAVHEVPLPEGEDVLHTHEDTVHDNPTAPESLPDTNVTPESIVTENIRPTMITRANSFRQEAEEAGKERDRLETLRKLANREGRIKDALILKGQVEEAEERQRRLHRKAEKRYLRAHNTAREPVSSQGTPFPPLDVHRLKVTEAIRQIELTFRKALLQGETQLQVIIGRGNHNANKMSVLKLPIMKAMQRHHISATVDRFNPGVIILTAPP